MATQAEPIRLRRRLPPPSAIGGVLFLIFVVGGVSVGIKQGVCPNNATAWVGLTVTGLRLGMIYAMIALGYTMVYGILQLLNFAHSEIFMIGSFAGLYTLSKLFGITSKSHPNGVGGADLVLVLGVALMFAAVASAVAAVLTERFAYRPLRRRGGTRLGYLITAIGVSLFLQNLFLLMDGGKHLGLPFKWPNIAGPGPVSYPQVLKRNTVFTIAGNPIDSLTLLIFVVALVMLVTARPLRQPVPDRQADPCGGRRRADGVDDGRRRQPDHRRDLLRRWPDGRGRRALLRHVLHPGAVQHGIHPRASRPSPPPCSAGSATSVAPCSAASSSAWWRTSASHASAPSGRA